jgi:sugar phosphate isomerase/epimerase
MIMSGPSLRPYAVNTYSYIQDHSAEACLRQLADLGASAFELMMYPGHCWPNQMDAPKRRDLERLCRESGWRFTSLNMPNVDMNIAAASIEMRRYSLAVLRGIFELAGDLGSPAVVIGPGKANPLFPLPTERMMGWFFEALDELVPIAEKAGTLILVENMPFAFLPGADELMAALERYGHGGIGVVYDVANAVFIGENLRRGFERMQPRLRLVHLSDTGREVYRHDPVGRGVVPFRDLPKLLAAAGYREAPVLEIVSRAPNVDLPASVQKLAEMGWDPLGQS